MRTAAHLGDHVRDQDHAVIALDLPRTVFDTQTQVVTPATTQVVTPRLRRMVSSGVFENPPKPFLTIRCSSPGALVDGRVTMIGYHLRLWAESGVGPGQIRPPYHIRAR